MINFFLFYFRFHTAVEMSLRPKVVQFEAYWEVLRETVDGVITLGHVDRRVWNDRFSYPLPFLRIYSA